MSWFILHGDDLFTFIALVAAALQGDQQIPPALLHWIVDLGIIASIGHKVFFPSSSHAPVSPAPESK